MIQFSVEVAPYLFDRDHRRAVAALRQPSLNLGALPSGIARLDAGLVHLVVINGSGYHRMSIAG